MFHAVLVVEVLRLLLLCHPGCVKSPNLGPVLGRDRVSSGLGGSSVSSCWNLAVVAIGWWPHRFSLHCLS